MTILGMDGFQEVEQRVVPSVTTWTWNGPVGVNSNWDDKTQWKCDNPSFQGNNYPGDTPGRVDVVKLNSAYTGNCVIPATDNLNPIASLTTGNQELILNAPLTVQGGLVSTADNQTNPGSFQMANGNIIISTAQGTTGQLNLVNLSGNNGSASWSGGNFLGTQDPVQGSTSLISVSNTALNVSGWPGELDDNLRLQSGSTMTLVNMMNNVVLNGTSNTLSLLGSTLYLDQDGAGSGAKGGFAYGTNHTVSSPVVMDGQSRLQRGESAKALGSGEVTFAAPLYNQGGTIRVEEGQLLLTGKDANNLSFKQSNSPQGQPTGFTSLYAELDCGYGAEIVSGTLRFLAPSNTSTQLFTVGSTLTIDGAGTLSIGDQNGTAGTATMNGNLVINGTFTTMVYGANNTADALIVNGQITIASGAAMTLTGPPIGGQEPTQPTTVLEAKYSGTGNPIDGAFLDPTSTIPGWTTVQQQIKQNSPTDWSYQVW